MNRFRASVVNNTVVTLVAVLSALAIQPRAATAQSKALFKLRLATSTAGLDFAPIWIAQKKGFFKKRALILNIY